ncbi:glycosyltransferase family 2 protein [Paenibacillus sp. CMAA1364]
MYSKKWERYNRGYNKGYAEGMKAGQQSYNNVFEGTSIIIPTYNQRDYLIQCIDSIEKNTTTPYELIVVDNASDDGTAEYLQQRNKTIRCWIHKQNLGFAGAINTGLMMAKGTTILLLNNDILVGKGWLELLLTCLLSDPKIGVVGPVTNYIGGPQQIEVPYEHVDHMWAFATQHNVHDPSKWIETKRLVGFCLLFRRELFHHVGYLDEGYQVGNFEDEDWIVRVRLLGYRLIIAGDSFIHHYGSVSMKSLSEDMFHKVNIANESLFHKKWGSLDGRIEQVNSYLQGSDSSLHEICYSQFYPTHIFIKGLNEAVYYLNRGVKHLVTGQVEASVIRISQLEIRQIPEGRPLSVDEICFNEKYLSTSDGYPYYIYYVRSPEGTLAQIDNGIRREWLTDYALLSWGCEGRVIKQVTEAQWEQWVEGLPILPRTHIQSDLL